MKATIKKDGVVLAVVNLDPITLDIKADALAPLFKYWWDDKDLMFEPNKSQYNETDGHDDPEVMHRRVHLLAQEYDFDVESDVVDLEKSAPGPPPREGLKWKEETHRWIRPKELAAITATTRDEADDQEADAQEAADTDEIIKKMQNYKADEEEWEGFRNTCKEQLEYSPFKSFVKDSVFLSKEDFNALLVQVTDFDKDAHVAAVTNKQTGVCYFNVDAIVGGQFYGGFPSYHVANHEFAHTCSAFLTEKAEKQWDAVWEEEIHRSPIFQKHLPYACTETEEGFAEIAALMIESEPGRKKISQLAPKAFNFMVGLMSALILSKEEKEVANA